MRSIKLNTDIDLKEKIFLLESLDNLEKMDAQLFQQKLGVLKEITMLLVEKIESLNSVRSVNISRGISLHEEMRHFEIHLIQSALERTGGHQTKAAQLLGINLTTLHNKLKRLNISPQDIINAPIIHEDELFKTESSAQSIKNYTDEHFSRLAA